MNLISEAIKLHDAGTRGVAEMVNAELETKYLITDFYAWKSGKKKTPNTVQRVLRRFVINQSFNRNIADQLIKKLEPPNLGKNK